MGPSRGKLFHAIVGLGLAAAGCGGRAGPAAVADASSGVPAEASADDAQAGDALAAVEASAGDAGADDASRAADVAADVAAEAWVPVPIQ